jgi:hypothetical protein
MEFPVFLQVEVPDDLWASVTEYGPPGVAHVELVCVALRKFVHLEAGKALALRGGSTPEMEEIPRRRSEGFDEM